MLLTLLAAAGLFAALHQRHFDDTFITYRYATQLARGAGFVYNSGERVLSTTTPLYTLLLAPLAWLGWDVPLVSTAISALALALGGLGWWQLGRRWREPLVGLSAAVLYPAFPWLVPTVGAETALYCALLIWSVVAYAYGRPAWLGALLALLALTRPDGLLMVGVMLVFWLVEGRRLPPRAAVLWLALPLLAWGAWATWYFGGPLPVTLAAKQAQDRLGGSRSFWQGLLQQLRGWWPLWLRVALVALAAIGVLFGAWRHRRWLVLPLWAICYLIAYVGLGVGSYFWYYAPLAVGLVPLVALGIAAVAAAVRRWRLQWLTTLALLSLLWLTECRTLRYFAQQDDPRFTVYRQAGEWLRAHTPPDARVGMLEVGIVGFYSDRPIIDFAGLLQPAVARHFAASTGYDDAALWTIAQYNPDYLLLIRGAFPAVESAAARCERRQEFRAPAYPTVLDLYRCH